jgi:hypothetical protein
VLEGRNTFPVDTVIVVNESLLMMVIFLCLRSGSLLKYIDVLKRLARTRMYITMISPWPAWRFVLDPDRIDGRCAHLRPTGCPFSLIVGWGCPKK